MKKRQSPWIWVFWFIVLLWVSGATAADLYVDASASGGGDGSSDAPFRTIQQGINDADDGDTVWVRSGTYHEDIVIKNGITLRGVDWAYPRIEGTGNGVVVLAVALDNSTTIRGLHISGGRSTTAGGLELRESSVQVIDCKFSGNVGVKGGAVLVSGVTSSPRFSLCRFYVNTATSKGGGVCVVNGADPVFDQCDFNDNLAESGGGVYLMQETPVASPITATFNRCLFWGNTAAGKGGGVLCGNASGASYWVEAEFSECRFFYNSSENDGGGLWANYGGRITIVNSLFKKNKSQGNGNALFSVSSRTKIANSVFVDNTNDASGGYGIAASSTNNYFYLYNSILFQNGERELYVNPDYTSAHYNLIDGGYDHGTGNIDGDPQFADADHDDYHLLPISPCIDAGLNSVVESDEDYDRNARIVDGDGDGVSAVDMGMFELQRPSKVYVDDDWAGSSSGDIVGGIYTYGTNAFSHIQDGIDAVAGPGRVIVRSGSYFEHLTLKTNVMLEGYNVPPDYGYVVLVGNGAAANLVTINGCTTGITGISNFHLVLGNDGFAGVMAFDSVVSITQCEISGNGTGIHLADSSGEILSCRIFNNGVGIRNEQSNLLIHYCDVYGNDIRGIENMDASPIIEHSTIRDHDGALADSGAAIRNVNSSPVITDCEFDNNRIGSSGSPFGQGGAIYNDNAFPQIMDCTFTSNLAQYGGAVYSVNYSRPTVSGCRFESNEAERGGATYAVGVSPLFSACEFLNNAAVSGGGSYSSDAGGHPRFENCVFAGNETTGSGGAVFAGNDSVPRLINCVIWGNSAGTDGTGNGGGLYETWTQPIVINSIIRGNTPNQIYDSSGETTATYSNIEGGYPGTGNIHADPLFVDAAAYDFQLEPASPCIDSGVIEGGTVVDITLTARPQGSTSDMGIYEYAGNAMLHATPDPVDFGEVALGDIENLKVSLTNTGILDLVITGITLDSNIYFSMVPKAFPITLTTGSETVVMLSFEPGTTLGLLTNTLTITSNNFSGQVEVPLAGVGIPAPHEVTSSATIGGTIDPAGAVTVADGADQVFTITADTGYTLTDVLVDGVSVGAVATYTFNAVTDDHAIEAQFSAMVYTITATAGPNGSISPSGDVSVIHGSDQAFTITPTSGYGVDDVLVDGASVGAVETFTFAHVTGNHTIAVTFDTPHYEILASAGVGGTINPSEHVRVEALADQTFTITPLDWLEIADVLVDGVSVGAVSTYTFTAVTADHTIEAFFEDTVPDVWVDDDYTDGGANDGHTWDVDAFASAQNGIDAVTAPAVVHVAAGIYNELITLKSGIHVLGAGPDVAILDGAGLFGNVVTVGNVDETAVFEGFTVRNGVRTTVNSQGTGMNLIDSSPVLSHCIFEGNEVVALKNDNASPHITDCIFRNNDAGGMQNWGLSNPVLENCRFETNGTFGMENRDSSPVITNCDFIGNYVLESVPSPQGGAMINWDSNPVIKGCRFEDNVLDNDSGILSAGGGGAIYNLRSSPPITDCVFIGNGGASGGAIYNLIASPVITDCTFTNNRGGISDDSQGGAIYNVSSSAPSITNCVFTGNSGFRGGAMYISLSDAGAPPVTVTNCIFHGNTSIRHGAAVFSQFEGSALHIVNSVFYGNVVDSNGDGNGDGAAVYNDRGDVLLVNAIAWGNTGSVIYNENTTLTVAAQYSDVEGGYGEAADMNIDADPLFVDAPAGNFRLQPGSPCIDTGTSTSSVTLPDVDLDGTIRPLGLRHDMGTYEYAAGQDIDVSSASLDFNDTTVGATASLDLLIANAGDQDLSITAMALSDATHFGLSVPTLPAIVVPGSSLTLTVDFTPAGVGLQEADLTVTSNDPDEAVTVIALSGTGLAVTHTITASAGVGGQISPSGAVSVPDGSDQIFTITAGAGYTVSDVLVDGGSVGTVGSYTFTAVTADHTIGAQFELQAGISVGAVSGPVGEDGTAATFTVVLTREPSGAVLIPVISNDLAEATVSPNALTFTPTDWNSPQTVTVTGVDDAVDDGDKTVTILMGPAESDDPEFDGMDPSDPVLVNVDNDTAGIVVGAVSGPTDETGGTATFTLVLSSEPLFDVEITVASDDPTEGEVSDDTLIFSSGTWNVPQTVTVTGMDDEAEDGPVDYAVVLNSLSSDSNYDALDIPEVMITNSDDDNIQTTPGPDDGGGGGGGCFIGSIIN